MILQLKHMHHPVQCHLCMKEKNTNNNAITHTTKNKIDSYHSTKYGFAGVLHPSQEYTSSYSAKSNHLHFDQFFYKKYTVFMRLIMEYIFILHLLGP